MTADVDDVLHGLEHEWVTTHAEVVVATPNGDILPVAATTGARVREPVGQSVDIVEGSVAVVAALLVNLRVVEGLVVERWLGHCGGVVVEGG